MTLMGERKGGKEEEFGLVFIVFFLSSISFPVLYLYQGCLWKNRGISVGANRGLEKNSGFLFSFKYPYYCTDFIPFHLFDTLLGSIFSTEKLGLV